LDANNCIYEITAEIEEPMALTAGARVEPAVCLVNGEIDLTVSGGTTPYRFDWSNGAVTEDLTDLSPDNYTVTITDANNCTFTETYTIEEENPFTATAILSHVSCNGEADGTIELTLTGDEADYTYAWLDGSEEEMRSGLSAGNYAVTITDSNDCEAMVEVTITQPPAIEPMATITDAGCSGGGAIDLTVTGGSEDYTYAWSNDSITQDLENLDAGTYIVSITDSDGCMVDTNFTVLVR